MTLKFTKSLLTFKLHFHNLVDALRALDFHCSPGGQMNTAHILTRAGSQEVEGYLPPDIGDKVPVMLIKPFYGQANSST